MPWRRPKLGAAPLVTALVVTGVWTALRAATRVSLPVARPVLVTAPFHEDADTLRRNQTLSDLLGRHQIAGGELVALLAAAPHINPRRLRAGQVFEFRYDAADPRPERVRARLSGDELLWLHRGTDGNWRGHVERVEWAPMPVRITSKVQSSLYETLSALIPDSVLPPAERDRMIWDLTDEVYGWQIDFTRDVVEGDRFQILFERLTSSLGESRYGRLLAAHLQTRGKDNAAYVMSAPADGRNLYYDPQGRSLRRAFKLAPVPYRITSRFSLSRFHPILQIWRAHLGIDYHASIGTPVNATGDGMVLRAGRWDDYGIMVGLRHVNGIETRYAHLSRIAQGIHPGARVQQGDVIGYAGMTGLASAPHVHYEFLKNGRQQDPRRVDLGDGTPLPAARRGEFAAVVYHCDRLLNDAVPRILALGPN